MADFLIREYKESDGSDLMNISEDKWAPTIQVTAKSLLEGFDKNITKVLLAFCDDKMVGFIYGFVLPNNMLLPEFMYVKPEYRNNGIAQRLLDELEKQSQCEISMIYYKKSLHDYYEKMGYESGDALEVAVKTL